MHSHAKISNTTLLSFLVFLCIPSFVLLKFYASTMAGHMDEYDYLFVGKTLLAGQNWPTHTYIFGWDINWLLFGWAEAGLGGLQGARVISLFLSLVSLGGMYTFVLALWRSQITALVATILLAFEATHLYTGALATYDVISYTAFIWALASITLIIKRNPHINVLTLVACSLLCIAVLSKYTTAIYLPVIAIIIAFRSPLHAGLGALFIVIVLGSYFYLHYGQLMVLIDVQLNGAHAKNANQLDVVFRMTRQLGLLLLLCGLSFLFSLKNQRSALGSFFLLLLCALPLFLYHFLSQNIIALQKHLIYSSIFLIPIASWWIEKLISAESLFRWKPTLAFLSVFGFALYNTHVLNIMRNSAPDMSEVETYAEHITGENTVLSEDPYLFRYHLFDKSHQSQIRETNWLDNNLDGIYEHRDVKHAVWGRKFDYVFLNDQLHKNLNKTLRIMLEQRDYTVVLDEHYELQTLSGETRSGRISLYARNHRLTHAQAD